MIKQLPTQERLHELFYCVNGKLIRKIRPSHNSNTHIGDVAGNLNKIGYVDVWVDNVPYKAHRLVWKYYYGVDPISEIDHIDRDRSNNNIWNLRECVDGVVNAHNRSDTYPAGVRTIKINGKRVVTEYGKQMMKEYYQRRKRK